MSVCRLSVDVQLSALSTTQQALTRLIASGVPLVISGLKLVANAKKAFAGQGVSSATKTSAVLSLTGTNDRVKQIKSTILGKRKFDDFTCGTKCPEDLEVQVGSDDDDSDESSEDSEDAGEVLPGEDNFSDDEDESPGCAGAVSNVLSSAVGTPGAVGMDLQ